ncbi:MAG: hypothetical protein ABFS18_02060 [Thermodesulfobacteriota bacterium]
MKIQDEHLYHGAALAQIAEDPQFTAINALKLSGKNSRSAYLVNDSIAVYLKYASKPLGTYKEYNFTFNKANLAELNKLVESEHNLHVAMVCIKDREICCISYKELISLINKRKRSYGAQEPQYTILCTLKPRQAFRVNINKPGRKNTYVGEPLLVKRNNFPAVLF